MASPEPPAEPPEQAQQPGRTGIPLRTLTAWALIGSAAVLVLFRFLAWIFPPTPDLGTARFLVFNFADLRIIAPALLGVVVAFKLGPVLSNVKLMTTIALSTIGAAALFGLVAFFVGLADHFDTNGRQGVYAFGFVLQGLGAILAELLWLGLVVLAGLWMVKIAGSDTAKLPSVNINPEDE